MKESYYDSAASNMFASIRIVFEINLKSRVRGKNSNVDCSCKDEYGIFGEKSTGEQGLWGKPREGVEREGEREVRIEGTEQDEERGEPNLTWGTGYQIKYVSNKKN